MPKQTRYYKNNPIVEALCVVIFEPSSDGLDLKLPGVLSQHLPEYDGGTEYRNELTGDFEIPGTFDFKSRMDQVWLKSKNEKNVLSIGMDRIGIHRVGNYTSWKDDLKPRTKSAIEAYQHVKNQTSLSPNILIMRYINRLDLPGDDLNITDYILANVPFTGGLPDTIVQFEQSITYKYSDTTILNLNFFSTNTPPEITTDNPNKKLNSFILDFEYRTITTEKNYSCDEIMEEFQRMREKQYEAFESLITDDYRRLIG